MNKEEILEWLETHNAYNINCKYTINKDMSVDAEGEFKLTKIPDGRIPDGIKFNIIKGNFYCSNNELVTLEGGPVKVSGDFNCSYNKLPTLNGCPKEVGGSFYCNNNRLTTLRGCPKGIGGSFDCVYNKLTSLEGCPEEVGGVFYCYNNKLVNLKYMPATNFGRHTDFTDEVVNIAQDIMNQAKTYKDGVQTYQEYLDIFGDD